MHQINRALVSAFVMILAVVFTGCREPKPREFFVAVSGDDLNPGTYAEPWATFSKAVTQVLPGDTVYVRGGVYQEQLDITVSGTQDNPIIFASYLDERAEIDGSNLTFDSLWTGLININEQHDITVEGFTLRNASVRCIMVSDSERIVVRDNHTEKSVFSGIQAWGNKDLVIHGNEVVEANSGGEGTQECISVSHSSNFEITDNIVRDGFMEGIDVKSGAHDGIVSGNRIHGLVRLGIYIDGYESHTYNIDVFDNEVYQCQEGIRVNCEEGGLVENINVYGNRLHDNQESGSWIRGTSAPVIDTRTVNGVKFHGNQIWNNGIDGIRVSDTTNGSIANIEIYNNVIYGNGRTGIHVADFSSGTGAIDSLSIINNTLHDNGVDDGWACGGIFMNAGIATDVVIRNNIVSDNHLFSIGLADDALPNELTIDFNLIDGFRNEASYEETRGTNFVEADPLFVDEAEGDFRLGAGSPAIDAGTTTGAPDEDFDGTIRPQGGGTDIGAFESSS